MQFSLATRPLRSRWVRAASCIAALAALSGGAQAGIDTSGNPELFLTLYDQANSQKSYTLDLNVRAADFYINAQQDTGSYLFFTLDPSKDANLQSFLSTATLSSTRWAVLGLTEGTSPDQRILYNTLSNYDPTTRLGSVSVQTANYNKVFSNLTNGTFRSSLTFPGYIGYLNTATVGVDIISSTLNSSATFGSSLSGSAYPRTYAGKSGGFQGSNTTTDGDCLFNSNVCVGNPIGISSWFYKVAVTPNPNGGSAGSLTKVTADEFDNLTNDGYWGFIKDPNSSKYILSYTLPGSNPKSLVSTDEGRARLSFTDYSAAFGSARLVGVDVGASISAVPEPQSLTLMALGGALIGAWVRRQRRLGA